MRALSPAGARNRAARAINPSQRPAAFVAATYAVAGFGWILVSHWGLSLFVGDDLGPAVEVAKGLAFVLVTSIVLYAILSRTMQALQQSTHAQQMLADEIGEHAAEQRRLIHRLMHAEEEVHRAISTDLHDGPLQALTLSFMRLDAASHHVDGRVVIDPEQVNTAMQTIRRASDEIRAVARALHPPLLAEIGLCAALERHCQEVTRLTERNIMVELDGDRYGAVDPQASITAFRIAQEAIANAMKHTREGDVTVRLSLGPEDLVLDVQDPGPGFSPEHTPHSGLGLVSMRERAESVGGAFEIRSADRGGTHVHARVPRQPAVAG